MRTLITIAVLGATLAAPAQAQTTAAVEGAVDRAAAVWARIKSVRGTFEQTVTNPLTGSSASAHGDYAQERPNRLAIRFNDSEHSAIVSDGRALWVYLPGSTPGQVIKRPATEGGASGAPIDLTGQFLDTPRAKYTMTAAGTRTVDGHPAHGVMLVPKPGVGGAFTKATVWIDDDDSLIREFEETEASGIVRHIHLTTIDLNAAPGANAFVFTPPRGVRIVDQTKP